MSRQVTFDYSKAGSFISEEEIGYMKKLTLDAKETLVSKTCLLYTSPSPRD